MVGLTVNKNQVGISSPKIIYSGKRKDCTLICAGTVSPMHAERAGRCRKPPFTEGKRKLRGGAVTTVEFFL